LPTSVCIGVAATDDDVLDVLQEFTVRRDGGRDDVKAWLPTASESVTKFILKGVIV